jgi:hypothetical protein
MIQLLIVTLMIALGFVYWYGQKGTPESPHTVQESRSVIDDAERTIRAAEQHTNAQMNIETNP